jgi:hypothetical protein
VRCLWAWSEKPGGVTVHMCRPPTSAFCSRARKIDALKRASAASVGADRVVTMDLHAPQVQGFFHIPVDDLYALPVLCEAIERKAFPDPVVVSPDAGFVKRREEFANVGSSAWIIRPCLPRLLELHQSVSPGG